MKEIFVNKSSYLKLIDDFGFIDTIEQEISQISQGTNLNKNEESIADINMLIEEENKALNKPSKKKKGASRDYLRFKDARFIENEISTDDLIYLSKFKDEIFYESLQISEELKNKDHDMEAIKIYKKKVL